MTEDRYVKVTLWAICPICSTICEEGEGWVVGCEHLITFTCEYARFNEDGNIKIPDSESDSKGLSS